MDNINCLFCSCSVSLDDYLYDDDQETVLEHLKVKWNFEQFGPLYLCKKCVDVTKSVASLIESFENIKNDLSRKLDQFSSLANITSIDEWNDMLKQEGDRRALRRAGYVAADANRTMREKGM